MKRESKQKEKTSARGKVVFQSPKGMHDILPLDQPWWEKMEKAAKDVASFYNFLRIEPSLVEAEELFERSLGETSDIVEKQMYVLKGAKLVLRPEFTSSIARAYIQHGLSHLGQPLKLYSWGPVFRHESPQAGRYREFHQLDFEILGADSDPVYDAQIILALSKFIGELKLKDITTHINTIGCRVCRPGYRRKLQEYYKRYEKELCSDCKRRLVRNPLRLLDCKDESCVKLKADAPNILDHLCANCNRHFKAVLEFIDEVKIPYLVVPHLVRGLDYYDRTVFEMFAEGFDFAVASGGRFDGLIEMLGGRSTPAVGGAAGLERIVEVMKARGVKPVSRGKERVFFIHVGDLAKKKTFALIEQFIEADIPVIESLGRESLKAQLRAADKAGASLALIFGQKEAFEETIIIRDLKSGNQETIPLNKLVAEVKKRLRA